MSERDGSQVAANAMAQEGTPDLALDGTDKVVYLGPTEHGAKHDKKAADEANITYPSNATLDQDTGFQGYAPADVLVRQPKKRPRGQELSIVKDVLRLTKTGISDLVMEIACGLHNLRVTCRHPLPETDLRNLLNMAYSR